MSFSWDELVMIGMIEILGDPELVFYFMKILKKERNKFIENQGRDFHCSLRVTKEDRWEKTKELKEKGLYYMMSSMVPITCPIPFTNSEWKNSSENLRKILYFREGFMMKIDGLDNGISSRKHQLVSEKIKCLNKYMEYSIIRKEEYDEAVFDYMLFHEWRNDEYPYILLEYDYDSQPLISIIG